MMPHRTVDSALGVLPTPDALINAWATFDGTAGTISFAGSFNTTSVTDNGAGDYTVNWSRLTATATYAVMVAASLEAGISGANMRMWNLDDTTPLATGSTRVEFRNNSTGATADPSIVCVAVVAGAN